MNELLFLAMIAVDFSLVLFMYRLWGRIGLYSWVCTATVLANVQVLKTVELFGMTATLGNAAYASVFLATDILSETYGKKTAGLAVWLGFVALIAMTGILSLALAFEPAPADIAHESLSTLFSFLPRVTCGSLLAYLVSQWHDVFSYEWLKQKKPGMKYIWLHSGCSTTVSQLLDTLIFTSVAFWGLYKPSVFWSIVATTYLLKVIGALAALPFVRMAAGWKRRAFRG